MAEAKRHGEVVIKCISDKCIFSEYAVTVSNSRNEIVFHNNTSKNGIAEFEINTCDEYLIRVEPKRYNSPRAAYRWVTLSPSRHCCLYFIFSTELSSHGVTKSTFFLTDRNYDGLLIKKGEMYLCRVPM